MTHAPASTAARQRPARVLATVLLGGLLLFSFTAFLALGTWQVQRLAWKRDLIARVDARIHADPVPAPTRTQWPALGREQDEYRRVFVEGRFLPDADTATQALTELGAGTWRLAPLRTANGDIVLVNRGFAPSGAGVEVMPVPGDDVRISGLLRISEPGGGFLRDNDPARDRWHSRDVAAIAAARGLAPVAPYFIDADATTGADAAGWPRAGMTVVSFRNNHLSYALTWFALAALTALAGWQLVSMARGLRQHGRPHLPPGCADARFRPPEDA